MRRTENIRKGALWAEHWLYSTMFEIVISCYVKDNNIFPCLHNIRSNVKSNENTYPKGRALMQIYRVVPITKSGNCHRL